MLEEKALGSDLLKDKKVTYPETVSKPFKGDQIQMGSNPLWAKTQVDGEKIISACNVMKVISFLFFLPLLKQT